MTDEHYDLTVPGGKLRLYIDAPLAAGAVVEPSAPQAHYLLHVMRAREGDAVRLFNGRDGEWRAKLQQVSRRSCSLKCEVRIAAQSEPPDLWLAFAPIKKTPADYVAQKATELGVRVLQPVITHRTIARRVNVDRLRANAIEAAEQSGRVSVPEVRAAIELDALLKSWPKDRQLLFCDEGGDAPAIADALQSVSPSPERGGLGRGRSDPHPRAARATSPFQGEESFSQWGVLTGPEGGFDDDERALIRAQAFVVPVTLGPRIMRADTAALAALAVWQALCGDWI
jgi:16S rRNA (uracil1498-N3)-methyltransferase